MATEISLEPHQRQVNVGPPETAKRDNKNGGRKIESNLVCWERGETIEPPKSY